MRYHEINVLRQAGFNVIEHSPWHFEVISGKTVINIWPTKRKWMVKYDSGASYYSDAADLLRIVTDKMKQLNPPVMLSITDAEEEWRDGLNELAAEIAEMIV